jgi:hypothetical protein
MKYFALLVLTLSVGCGPPPTDPTTKSATVTVVISPIPFTLSSVNGQLVPAFDVVGGSLLVGYGDHTLRWSEVRSTASAPFTTTTTQTGTWAGTMFFGTVAFAMGSMTGTLVVAQDSRTITLFQDNSTFAKGRTYVADR